MGRKKSRLEELKERLKREEERIAWMQRAIEAQNKGASEEEVEAIAQGMEIAPGETRTEKVTEQEIETDEERKWREKREQGLLCRCKVCESEYEPVRPNQIFCSALCRVLYWQARRNIEITEQIKCRTCGELFTPTGNRKVYCSETCAQAYMIVNSVKAPARSHPLKMRFEVFMRDKFSCRYCGRSPLIDQKVTLVTDHIVPVAEGGRYELSNLVACCLECNQGKGDVLLDKHAMRKLIDRNILLDTSPTKGV